MLSLKKRLKFYYTINGQVLWNPHLVMGPFNLNFLHPTNPMAVLVPTVHAGLNEVEIRALHAKEIDDRGLNQKVCYNGVRIIQV